MTEDLRKSDMVTIRNVDKLKLEEISCKIEEFEENLKNGKDENINRRNTLTNYIPPL